MKKHYLICLFLLLAVNYQVLAQGKFNLEFYGGPQRSYNKVNFNPAQPEFEVTKPWNYNLGINFLTRLRPNLQLAVQAEYSRNNQKAIQYPNFPALNGSYERTFLEESFGNYSVGLRYNWDFEKLSLFVQPSFGVTLNNYFEPSSTPGLFTFESATQVNPNLRLETGIKYYTQRKNYFVVGLRHQQGLQNLNTVSFGTPENSNQLEINRKASYSSLFFGYGIDLSNWSKSKRMAYRDETRPSKESKRDLAWSNGAYLIGSGFLRFRPKSEREDNLEFSHITSGTLFGAGYRWKSLSIESGYATFGYANSISIPGAESNRVVNSFQLNAIPLTFKYDFLIGEKKRLRVGPSLSTYFITNSSNKISNQGGFGGPNYNLSFTSQNTNLNGKVFFNAGIYAELPIFNSSLINFKVSQNFGSLKIGTLDLSGEVNGEPVNFESSGTLNGFMLEMGYKLPLNLIFNRNEK